MFDYFLLLSWLKFKLHILLLKCNSLQINNQNCINSAIFIYLCFMHHMLCVRVCVCVRFTPASAHSRVYKKKEWRLMKINVW